MALFADCHGHAANVLDAGRAVANVPHHHAGHGDGCRLQLPAVVGIGLERTLERTVLRLERQLQPGRVLARLHGIDVRCALDVHDLAGFRNRPFPARRIHLQSVRQLDQTAEKNPLRLYANSVKAPDPVSLILEVDDLDVSHREYLDYYGETMVEMTIHNAYHSNEPVHLYCMIYEDDSAIGRSFPLPHDSETISSGKTQTITVPLSAMTDPDSHEKIRVVIRGIGLEETATFNNEFEIWLRGAGTKPEPTPTVTPRPIPVTGDGANPFQWLGLLLLGLLGLLAAALITVRRPSARPSSHDTQP